MRLGYLGPAGSYSYEAAKIYAPHAELISMRNFHEIIQGVEDGIIDEGVLPIENSTEGAVTPVMDELLKTKDATIIKELVLPIRHNLISIGTNIKEIHSVYSHPQAIEQCKEYFRRELPQVSLIPCESTSLACLKAKEKGKDFAAIANTEAASIYNLNILQSDIQDNSLNQTRFVVISKNQSSPCLPCKTSLAFSFSDDRPGALYTVLKEFADINVNLTRIESRPAKTDIGKYVFYIDLIGLPTDPDIAKALSNISDMTVFLKILGSYSILEKD